MSSVPGYVLIISCKLKPGQRERYSTLFKELADYVQREEPQTLQYQFYEHESDPDAYMLIERYASKAYLEEVHWKSEAMAKFRAQVAAGGFEWVSKDVSKFYDNGCGFVVAPPPSASS